MRSRALLSPVLAGLSFGLSLALLSATPAGAADTVLRWTHPNAAEVTGFTVHVGYSPRSYEAGLTQTFSGLAADAEGIFQVTIDVEPDRTIYVAVRAYNAAETSSYSNERTRYQATPLGVPGRPRLSEP